MYRNQLHSYDKIVALLCRQKYCDELARVDARFEQMTPDARHYLSSELGKTSTDLIQAAASCGYAHVGFKSPAGFLGDELSSAQYPGRSIARTCIEKYSCPRYSDGAPFDLVQH